MGTSTQSNRKPWWLHVLAVSVGTAAYFFASKLGYGWASSIGAALGALLFPAIIYYRRAADIRRFWQMLAMASAAQIPLVLLLHRFADRFGFPFLLLFGAADCVFVASLITRP